MYKKSSKLNQIPPSYYSNMHRISPHHLKPVAGSVAGLLLRLQNEPQYIVILSHNSLQPHCNMKNNIILGFICDLCI